MSVPADYVTARQRFRDVTERLGWIGRRYPVSSSLDGDLTIDVAISPATNADAVLVVSSGLHGVEGAFGSVIVGDTNGRFFEPAPGRNWFAGIKAAIRF